MNTIPTAVAWPQHRELVDATMDSRVWNNFELRDNDIIIDSWAKAGTTLTQQIVCQLLFNGSVTMVDPAMSPWLDCRLTPHFVELAREQTHRRFLKSHLPAESLPYAPFVKYLYIARDVRDVIWSWHNHVTGFTDQARALAAQAAPELPPTPRPTADVRAFYHEFLAGGPAQFQPFWSHIQGWWDLRHLPNVLLLHYADMLNDLPAQIRRVAAFLEIPIKEQGFPEIVAHCQMDFMRKAGGADPFMKVIWRDGANTFYNKGTNSRWRTVLNAEEIAEADKIAARELTPDCAAWLAQGGAAT